MLKMTQYAIGSDSFIYTSFFFRESKHLREDLIHLLDFSISRLANRQPVKNNAARTNLIESFLEWGDFVFQVLCYLGHKRSTNIRKIAAELQALLGWSVLEKFGETLLHSRKVLL